MGYWVQTEEIDFLIEPDKFDDAYMAMCQLNFKNALKRGGYGDPGTRRLGDKPKKEVWFSWMEWNYHETCEDAEDVFKMLGFETQETDEGLELLYYDNKSGQEDLFLEAVAPFVKSGSYIVWKGEDGAFWKNTFEDGKFGYEPGQVVFGN